MLVLFNILGLIIMKIVIYNNSMQKNKNNLVGYCWDANVKLQMHAF
jgi:hypothetical protein